jgi:D-xylose transport system permease protein
MVTQAQPGHSPDSSTELHPSNIMDGSKPLSSQTSTDWGRVFSLREMGVFYALILVVLILSLTTTYLGRPNFFSVTNLSNVLYQSSLVGIIAVAMTVILITGNFDLSVASVAALAGAVLIGTADSVGFWPAFGLAMLVAVGAGLLNGVIVQLVGINAFIVTLGTLTAIRGLVLVYTDGRSLAVGDDNVLASMRAFESGRVNVGILMLLVASALILIGLYQTVKVRRERRALSPASVGMLLGGVFLVVFSWLSNFQLTLPNPVIYLLIFTGALWFVLNFTTVGRRVYAVGGNPEAARLSGINVLRYKMAAFVLCSAAAGFAGILFASRLRSINPAALTGAELTVIASAILGGTSLFGGAGSVIKTLVGAFLLFTLTNGFNILNLGANYQGMIEGVVVVTAAAIYTVGGNRRAPKR